MGNIVGDLRYALRLFRNNPGFVAVAVLSLALGIGANTAIFTLLDTVVLKMLPVEKPEELAVFGPGFSRGINGESEAVNRSNQLFSYPLYKDLRDDNSVFQQLAAIGSMDYTVYVRDTAARPDALPEAAQARIVSGNYFEVLGIQPAAGRLIHPSDDVTPGAHAVVVLSHGYWQRRFASDPSIVGKTLLVQGQAYAVIGVAPEGFRGETLGWNPDLFAPLAMQQELSRFRPMLADREMSFLLLLGRLKPGIGPEQASAAMTLRFQQALRAEAGGELSPEREQRLSQRRIEITPAHRALSSLRRQFEEPLLLLMAVVGLVLLIACANVANLLLARATARRKEVGVRLALGAGRGRLVRQLLTESLLLSGIGGLCGLLIAPWATQFLVRMVYDTAETIPLDLDPDLRVLGFTLAVSALTGLLFGLAPALRATRLDLAPTLKVNSRGTIGETARVTLSKGLVVTQVALSLLLLVGAGLFVGTLRNLRSLNLGFRPEKLLLVAVDPRGAGYSQDRPEQLKDLYRKILDRLRTIPEVESASLSFVPLLSGARRAESVEVEGYTFGKDEPNSVREIHVTPGYFETVGMTLVEGRPFDERDRDGSQRVAVVNQKFAERFFAGRSVIGSHLSFDGGDRNLEIVGVAGNAKYNDMREQDPELVFLPVYQALEHLNSLETRARGEPDNLSGQIKQALSEVDRNLPVRSVTTMHTQVDRALRQERLMTNLTSFFGLLALLLASVGLFGVMSYAVSRRTSEIGIRMALGAERAAVLWMVLRESLGMVVVGAAAGLAAAFASTRLLANLLYAVSPTDPLAFGVAAGVLLAVAALAAYIPARRAARVDPMVALRYE
jgi:predicted permease